MNLPIPTSDAPAEMTEGRAALIAGGHSLESIAKRARVPRGMAQRWRQGITRPNPDARTRLAAEPFSIAPEAWERLAPGSTPSVAAVLAALRARPQTAAEIAPGVTPAHASHVLERALGKAATASQWPAVIAIAEVLRARARQ